MQAGKILILISALLVGVITFLPAHIRDGLTEPISTSINKAMQNTHGNKTNADAKHASNEISAIAVSKMGHVIVFFFLGIILALQKQQYRALNILLLIAIISTISESLQHLVYNRTPSLRDIGINVASGLFGLFLSRLISKINRFRKDHTFV